MQLTASKLGEVKPQKKAENYLIRMIQLGKVKPQIKADNYLIRMIELGTCTKEMHLCWLDRRG